MCPAPAEKSRIETYAQGKRSARKRKRRPRIRVGKLCGMALCRLADTINLARHRRAWGVVVEPRAFALVGAHALADLEGMWQRSGPHGGCDALTMRAFLKSAGLGDDGALAIDMVELMRARDAGRSPFTMTMDLAGRTLRLTSDERRELSIRTLEAIDQTAAERKAAAPQIKRDKARERAALKRRLKGVKPRRNPVTEPAPWELEGMSRATWYRRSKQTREPVAALDETPKFPAEESFALSLGVGELRVSQHQPKTQGTPFGPRPSPVRSTAAPVLCATINPGRLAAIIQPDPVRIYAIRPVTPHRPWSAAQHVPPHVAGHGRAA